MNWPHAPDNWLYTPGHYFVTAGTLHRTHLMNTPERLSLVLETLFDVSHEFGWSLRAWAILVNHYHFVARSPENPDTLRPMLAKLHGVTARLLNTMDRTQGRTVWYRFMSTPLTFERSLLARLHYTHYNPQRHGVVPQASAYAWCSAAWFERNASPAFVNTVSKMKSDAITDDY